MIFSKGKLHRRAVGFCEHGQDMVIIISFSHHFRFTLNPRVIRIMKKEKLRCTIISVASSAMLFFSTICVACTRNIIDRRCMERNKSLISFFLCVVCSTRTCVSFVFLVRNLLDYRNMRRLMVEWNYIIVLLFCFDKQRTEPIKGVAYIEPLYVSRSLCYCVLAFYLSPSFFPNASCFFLLLNQSYFVFICIVYIYLCSILFGCI